jgi:hypothetical protein
MHRNQAAQTTVAGGAFMPASPSQTSESKPTFVFKGTIKKLKGATMDNVPIDDRTAIVTVDQIIEAPADLAGYNGQDITVQLSGRQKVKKGTELIFHTVSWMYGESIAVRSLGEEPIKPSHAALLSAAIDPSARRAQREQQEHFEKADLIVSGKVVAVRLPSDTKPPTKAVAGLAPESTTGRPISEHDPKWREAVIQVDDVHKGSHKKKQVVVRFPASTDVMWYSAPKFRPGQQGYFALHKAEAEKPKRKAGKKRPVGRGLAKEAVEPKGETAATYTALDAMDFQPYDEAGGIKSILESESTKK